MVKVIRSIITFAFSDLAKTVKSPRTKVKQLVDPEDPPQQLDTEDDLRMARTREHDLIEELEIKAKVHALDFA
jgi:Asp/Glu/hydantoin racemase